MRQRKKQAASAGTLAAAAGNIDRVSRDTPIIPRPVSVVKRKFTIRLIYLIEKLAYIAWAAVNARLLAMLAGGER